ncbi:MAG: hypothetical protein ACR2MX_05140 [Cyclobacteriaceae bacterium]
MTSSGGDLRVSNGGWVELYYHKSKELFCECFYNLSEAVKGKGFIVVLLKSGRMEVYNAKLELKATQLFHGIKSFSATEFIEVVFINGNKETYNSQLKPIVEPVS